MMPGAERGVMSASATTGATAEPLNDAVNAGLIAIIGMHGRFPGAADLDQYWRNLRDGVETISRFGEDELRAAGVPEAQFRRPDYVPAGSAMNGFDEFDADFFGYTSREAVIIDPQHRVFLETCWAALEYAGYAPGVETGSVGVFGGASTSAYLANVFGNLDFGAGIRDSNVGMGNELGFLTARVSYKLDLHGPSYPVQTACSTSLVALHIARQSLLNYECDMALAGAVAYKTPAGVGYMHQDGGITSPDGHCRPFDAEAQGTLFNNGAGVVVLKRLEEAIAAGDTIYGVLRGSAVNNDGSVKASFSAPSVTGQAAVIADALADAGVAADTIQYVEGHGSGTRIGDAIEIQALTEAYRLTTDGIGFAAIGSVKSNLGHLDAAAGMAGLIKVLLAFWHETLPPTVHFARTNPDIDFASSPFRVQGGCDPWPRGGPPRRAGVSAFGFGGTNAHVVVDEPPRPPARVAEPEAGPQLLVISARTATALEAATDRLAAALEQEPTDAVRLHDIATTLAVGRRAFAHRRVVIAADHADAARALRDRDPVTTAQGIFTEAQPPRIGFGFGCGSREDLAVTAGLYRDEPRWRSAADRCAKVFATFIHADLVEVLLADDPAARCLAALATPLQFLVGYATAELWSSWGIVPNVVAGAGVGELVAATVARVLNLADACRLTVLLGRLEDAAAPTRTVLVPRPWSELDSHLPNDVRPVRILPSGVVVAGPTDQLALLGKRLAVRLRASVESAPGETCLNPVAAREFADAVDSLNLATPEVPVVSAALGAVLDVAQLRSPAYWRAVVSAPADLAAAMQAVLDGGTTIMLDLTPGRPFAAAAIAANLPAGAVIGAAPRPRDLTPREPMMRALGRLWLSGVQPDWATHASDRPWRRVGLPTYPFERARHWLESPLPPASAESTAAKLEHDLLDAVVLDSYNQQVYETNFQVARQWVVSEHRLLDEALVPGTTYLEMARAAASQLLGTPITELVDVEFFVPLLIRAAGPSLVHTTVRRADGAVHFSIASRQPGQAGARSEWTLHAQGSATTATGDNRTLLEPLLAIRERCTLGTIDRETLAGPHPVMTFGGRWNQSLQSVAIGDHVAVGRLALPESYREELERLPLHPAMLDLATGFGGWAVLDASTDRDAVQADSTFFLPISYDRLHLYSAIPAECYSVIRTDPQAKLHPAAQIRRADVTVYDLDGAPVLDIRGFTVKRVTDPQATVSRLRRDELFHVVDWLPAPQPGPAALPGRLLVVDLDGTGETTATQLRRAGAEVVIAAGHDEEVMRRALNDFRGGSDDTIVIHVSAPTHEAELAPANIRDAVKRDLMGLFEFARALASSEHTPGALIVLAEYVHAVTGAEPQLAPLSAALFGLAKVIEHENEGLRCRCLDLDPQTSVESVLNELAARDEPSLIAYRGGARYRAVLVALKVDDEEDAPPLPAESTVLITGGLGGLGLAVAAALATRVPGVRLALVSRRGIGEGAADPRATRARRAVAELEAAGAQVCCYAVDVADEAAMSELVTDIRARWGGIYLAVHAAGMAGDGFILRKDADVFEGTVTPKIAGAVVLDTVTRDDPPKLLVAFGSTAALFGAAGQSDYVAANCYLDAWAAWRRQAGRPTVTVDWTDWTETGMAADHDVAPDQGFFRSITPPLAVRAFITLLRHAAHDADTSQVIVGAINHPMLARVGLAIMKAQFQRAPVGLSPALVRTILDSGAAVPADPVDAGPAGPQLPPVVLTGAGRSTDDPDPYTETERMVAAVWGFELSRAEIPVDVALFDLGCDSLIALRIAQGIQLRAGRTIKLATLFAHPTVAEFAHQLDELAAYDTTIAETAPPTSDPPKERLL
jgi:acyl transferase domain-containing protein/aryl carrier-like protein